MEYSYCFLPIFVTKPWLWLVVIFFPSSDSMSSFACEVREVSSLSD